jgi:hypothetical protein
VILDQWWVYVGIAAWAVVLDCASLLSASSTFRFLTVPSGLAFLLLRVIAALIAGLLIPVILTEKLKLNEMPAVVVFLSPLITITTLELLLTRVGATSGNEQVDLVGLLVDLRRLTVAESRRKANEAKQAMDIRTSRALGGLYHARQLQRMLLDLLHTKMPTFKDARTRLEELTVDMSQDDDSLRQELATEIVKIDREYAKTTLSDRSRGIMTEARPQAAGEPPAERTRGRSQPTTKPLQSGATSKAATAPLGEGDAASALPTDSGGPTLAPAEHGDATTGTPPAVDQAPSTDPTPPYS